MAQLVITAREAAISSGLNVRRILPYHMQRMVGPFIFLDHAGPMSLPSDPRALDVLPHPHIGLATVSYLLDGAITHRDSLGVEQVIQPGEVNWMTAGKGIAHSERFEDASVLKSGGLELLQSWVALPTEYEEINPSFVNIAPNELPTVEDSGVWMRLIAGNAYGLRNNVETLSPLFYVHVELQTNARITLPTQYSERAMYVVKGNVKIDTDTYHTGQMIVFGNNEEPTIKAIEPSTVMMLGGEPVGKRFIWWNFVASTRERIEQAKEDWTAGRIILPPNDDKEFIPLPPDQRPSQSPPDAPLLS